MHGDTYVYTCTHGPRSPSRWLMRGYGLLPRNMCADAIRHLVGPNETGEINVRDRRGFQAATNGVSQCNKTMTR